MEASPNTSVDTSKGWNLFIRRNVSSLLSQWVYTEHSLGPVVSLLSSLICYTTFTLHAVSPAVGRVWWNLPVLGPPSDIRMRPFGSVANRPLPCESYGSFRLFKISSSDFCTVGMRRRFCACVYEFLTTVNEGVVHGLHKVVIRSSFGVIRRRKVSSGIGRFIRRHPKVSWGCFSVTNVWGTVILLLLTVNKPCPISGRPPVVWTNRTKWGDLGGGSAAE